MNTKNEQKEIERLIRVYKGLSDTRLKELLKKIENSSGTAGGNKRNRLRAKAIRTLLL